MERVQPLIELDVASTATMGPGGDPIDEFAGLVKLGLNDD